MKLNLNKTERVELKQALVAGERYDFVFEVAPLPTSILLALRKAKNDESIIDYFSPQQLANLVKGWNIDGDEGPMPCTPENILAVIDASFEMFGILAAAVLMAFNQGQRGNSLTSSDTTSTTESGSAEGAGQTNAQEA